ncbi:hypothetical protein [Bradyrhizobium sp. LTSP885]|uniref:hypothetical protein n=1 Tax=Bradyrhizobium sp. LTSP885 TaxID=1619232 RepID=UPI001FD94B53|nr:hypothetical protein [Bradyrhizobium sp. LTSP885]
MNSSIAASTIAARRSADFSARFAARLVSDGFGETSFDVFAAAARTVVRPPAGEVRVDFSMRFVMPIYD